MLPALPSRKQFENIPCTYTFLAHTLGEFCIMITWCFRTNLSADTAQRDRAGVADTARQESFEHADLRRCKGEATAARACAAEVKVLFNCLLRF